MASSSGNLYQHNSQASDSRRHPATVRRKAHTGMENGTGEGIILGIISACGGGDWPPVLALAAALRERGHVVRVVVRCRHGRCGPRRRAPGCLPACRSRSGRFFYPPSGVSLPAADISLLRRRIPYGVGAGVCILSSIVPPGMAHFVLVSAMMCRALRGICPMRWPCRGASSTRASTTATATPARGRRISRCRAPGWPGTGFFP